MKRRRSKGMNGWHIPCVYLVLLAVAACVNMPRNYVPAGFTSTSEVHPYLAHYLYFASRLTQAEWDAFYARFPEYFKDIHMAKAIGSTIDIHPWYAAYAFRWTTLQRRESWSLDLRSRLERGDVQVNDDVFQLVYGKGPPDRMIWDNDVEVLLYADSTAFIMSDSRLMRVQACGGCWQEAAPNQDGMTVSEVLEVLAIGRRRY